jgi:hypothetical protein
MIICSASNIDLIQGALGYGDATEGINITDWRISNTQSAIAGQSGVFNIFNSSSITPNISIVDNGTVGIGTVPSILSTSKMEIVGNVNITGAYNINNRNVINDTSNYVLSTSNALVSRINASGGGGSGSLTSGGNLSLSNSATSNTVLSIANSNVVVYSSNYTSNVITETYTAAATPSFTVGGPSTSDSITSSIDKFMIFTSTGVNHTFTVPSGGLNCDVLMIGGGGSYRGGAGACIVAINQTLPAGSCIVNVGAGGVGYNNGSDSYIQVATNDRYRAKGGGGSSNANTSGVAGGCGGGAEYNSDGIIRSGGAAVQTNVVNGVIENTPPRITSTYAVMGNAGGNNPSINTAGGGGGIGTAAVTSLAGNGAYQVTLTGAATPINFRAYFANGSTSFGVQDGTTGNYYIGGGGGGYWGGPNPGGLGGGGGSGGAGVANTGSGAGNGLEGGSGIIIIRYRSVTTTTTPTTITIPATFGTPSIELIRGIAGDNNLDYKLGNYDGNFLIKSSISNTDTDRLSITSSGNINILNNSTNSTALSIINSNIVVGATPATTSGRIDTITTTGSPSQGTIGTTDRFMIFTANGSFTVPTGGIVCDILMIGGGGAGGGGSSAGGGGGAGACIVAINQTLSTTGTYTVNVGAGDVASGTTTGAGGDSTIILGTTTLYQAKGGGRGERADSVRNQGGCGGGAGYGSIKTGGLAVNTNMVAGTIVDANARGATFAVFGNKGGDRPDSSSGVTGAGGGGIGGAGGNHILGTPANINAGPGGVGLFQATVGGTIYNFRSYFANGGSPYNFGALNSVDSQYYIGGGGGGSVNNNSVSVGPNVGGIGGVGGGGAGGITSTFVAATGAAGPAVNAVAGAANTGGGGGGAPATGANGGNGGSGIVIIRYRAPPATVGVPSVELVRGIAGDSNHDYKVGNYDGNFKIMSAVSGAADTERLNITTAGNVGIGTSSPANELHIFDSTTSATSLIIQNNNSFITSNTVQGTSTSSVTTGTSFIADFADSNVPSVHEAVATAPTDRIMIFTTAGVNHTFTVPSGGLNCDILMIGGGGGSGQAASGGGAGACIVAINQTLPAGSCIVRVGTGGSGNSGYNGNVSFISVGGVMFYKAIEGGGGGQSDGSSGSSGGCGGGAGYNTNTTTEDGGAVSATNVVNSSQANIGPSITSTYAVMCNAGGNNGTAVGVAGSGGGIGVAGTPGGAGGNGAYQVTLTGAATPINFRSYFANGSTTFGVQDGTTGNYYIGGGGGGYNGAWYSGGLGGGGGSIAATPTAATPNTGSGGGRYLAGGSGIVIIRYRSGTSTTTYTHETTITTTLSTPTLGTPSIELVRGTQGDSNTDYKIGNYNGDFIVKSSVSNTDTDRLNITTAGNVGIGITNPAVKLQVVGGDFACSGDISAYFSDERLKTRISNIKDPLEIIGKLNGFYYIPNDLARYYGIKNMAQEIGLSAQDVRKVLPELVKIAPFDLTIDEDDNKVSKSGENYLTISYDRLAPVFVEAIKELQCSNVDLTEKYNRLLELITNNKKDDDDE